MRFRGSILFIAAVFLVVASLALAGGQHSRDLATLLEAQAVMPEDGLAAWDSIHTVLIHPPYLNCHEGAGTTKACLI